MAAILITEPVHTLLPEGLKRLGFEVVYEPSISPEEVITIIPNFEGLVINSKVKGNKELINLAPKLKFIARCGSGKEVMDINYAATKGIECITSPEGNRQAVAEHALGLLLALMNNIAKANSEVKNTLWLREPNRGFELYGKTIGIIGFGNTGEAFAKVLAGFNVKVLAHDKYRSGFSQDYIHEATLEKIYNEADIVSLHLPLTEETKYFADEAFFNAFAKPIWFLNTARGLNVVTQALIHGLENRKIIAAGLDVLENEKIASLNEAEKMSLNQLSSFQNVIITPHIAGWTHESKQKIAQVLLEKITAIYA